MQNVSPFASVSVVGGGAWGTALANLAARNGVKTRLWAREPEVAASINSRHENRLFLSGVALDPRLTATTEISDAAKADAVLFVAPAQHSRSVLSELRRASTGRPHVALCCKGIEEASGLLMTEVLFETWPEAEPSVLSGPSFAKDVALGLPTAVTFACRDASAGKRWIKTIGAPHFRPYLSDDLVGAEIGGAVKNVLAIAAGAVEGRGLGESARAAVIARGFAEMQRFGAALGAKRETLAGLSGLGDLILTATSKQSRNYSLGVELGQGRAAAEILRERNSVAEGAATAGAVVARAKVAKVEMPIAAAVCDLVAGRKAIDAIIAELLARPLKSELA
jgi:glycerol-3-phosphate dehydrogenase (NAD(P)+)